MNEGYVTCTLKSFLDSRGITRYRLTKMTGVDDSTIDSYYKNKNFRYDAYILAKMCHALDCDISDLLEYVPPK